MIEFHFIRPLWLLALLPVLVVSWFLLRQTPLMQSWSQVCDRHLLSHLIQARGHSKRIRSLLLLLTSMFLMIASLAGPTWSRLPVPTYIQIQPRVLVLDMAETMLNNDLSPDRLSRAKFKLHDLFNRKDAGQFGLIVYSGESFVVSPLTDDGQTIDALLSTLTTDIMPMPGENLDAALTEAGKLIEQAGFQHGEILVLTSEPPTPAAINIARNLATRGVDTSVIPITNNPSDNASFQHFATAGKGEVIPLTDTSADLDHWLAQTADNHRYSAHSQNDIPEWRDQGRWVLMLALMLLLPVFRRGWIARINT